MSPGECCGVMSLGRSDIDTDTEYSVFRLRKRPDNLEINLTSNHQPSDLPTESALESPTRLPATPPRLPAIRAGTKKKIPFTNGAKAIVVGVGWGGGWLGPYENKTATVRRT